MQSVFKHSSCVWENYNRDRDRHFKGIVSEIHQDVLILNKSSKRFNVLNSKIVNFSGIHLSLVKKQYSAIYKSAKEAFF